MGRGAWILIAALVGLGVAALTATVMIRLLEGSEYLEFAIVIVLFLAVLLSSYWFLLAPAGQQGEEPDNE
jgi:protein-S-isoprenylcysteine O-methyltransferase Ste14